MIAKTNFQAQFTLRCSQACRSTYSETVQISQWQDIPGPGWPIGWHLVNGYPVCPKHAVLIDSEAVVPTPSPVVVPAVVKNETTNIGVCARDVWNRFWKKEVKRA